MQREHPTFPVGDYFPEVTHPDSVEDVVARFRLEWAAPELLAALRSIVKTKQAGGRILDSQWACAVVAIAKAEGRA